MNQKTNVSQKIKYAIYDIDVVDFNPETGVISMKNITNLPIDGPEFSYIFDKIKEIKETYVRKPAHPDLIGLA